MWRLLLVTAIALCAAGCVKPPYPKSFPLTQLRLPTGSVITNCMETPWIDYENPRAEQKYFMWFVYFINRSPEEQMLEQMDKKMEQLGFTRVSREELLQRFNRDKTVDSLTPEGDDTSLRFYINDYRRLFVLVARDTDDSTKKPLKDTYGLMALDLNYKDRPIFRKPD